MTSPDTQTHAQPVDHPFTADSLNASLTVSDLSKSLAWYHDIVGFTVDRRHEHEGVLRSVSLSAGAVRILLNQDNFAKGHRPMGVGFSLMINCSTRCDDTAERMTRNGGTLDSQPANMPWGMRMFRAFDPDGYLYVFASAVEP